MAKRYTVILSLLLVFLIATAVVVVTGVFDINKRLGEANNPSDSLTLSVEDIYQTETAATQPLMRTDFENVFFTMTKQGDVNFYEAKDGKLTQIPETGKFEVTAECSKQKLPAVIHYIQREGKTNGYGLFTNLLYPNVLLYDYAFFKVTDMNNSFKSDDGTLMMLLDVDKERFNSDKKVYSEIFYLYKDHTSKHFLSEEQRTPDLNARLKTDYKMFTDDILDQNGFDNVIFFTSRNYVSYEDSGKVDIFTSGGSGPNIDNIKFIEDVADLHFWRTANDTYYLKSRGENGETFTLSAYNGKESRDIRTFEGDPKLDFIYDGNRILDRSTGELYDVLSATSVNLPFEKFSGHFAPDMFAVSENGRYAIMRGINQGNASCGIVDTETGAAYVCTDDVFRFVSNVQALNDGTFIVSVANGESATAFYQFVANIGQLDIQPAE